MIISGKIIRYSEKKRNVYVLFQKKVYPINLTNFLNKQYGRYFNNNVYLTCEISIEKQKKQYVLFHRLIKILKLEYISGYQRKVYYDFEQIKQGIKKVINHQDNILFIDLELSMHPFYKSSEYVQEIIQCGYLLENNQGKIIEKNNFFIKPVLYPKLTKRTIKFLTITQSDVDKGITPSEFYTVLKDLLKKYQPKIIVWGKNDILSIKAFYKISNFVPLTKRQDFINLLQLYKTYHSLREDRGLFKCYESYGKQIDKQVHNALEDAIVTREVYHLFKEEVNKKSRF